MQNINWIKVLYTKPRCQIINNIVRSCFFHENKGAKQRDRSSLTIFVLCVEYLAEMLRQNKKYQSFKIISHCFKVYLLMIR